MQHLEEGDPFTTSLIEILVKELADRQTRPSAPQRYHVNARTAQELHRLANESDIYHVPRAPYSRTRNRSNFHVGVANTADGQAVSWYARPAYPYDSMDDDEFDDVTANEHIVSIEGARLDSSHLYDVYRQNSMANPSNRQAFHAVRRPVDNATGTLFGFPIQASPPTAAIPGTSLPSVSSNSSTRPVPLVRVPTTNFTSRPHVVRRLRSSRAADFNDFSARRRNAQRTSASEDPRAQESSSSTSSSTSLLVPVRSPLQTVPPIIPPPPSASASSISPASPHPPGPQIIVQHGPPSPLSAAGDGEVAPGSNIFYSTALSNSLARSNAFADRRLPVPRNLHNNYVPPPELLPHRAPLRDESAVLRPIGHISDSDDFTAMFRDDFERDFGAWFTSGADDAAHTSSNGRLEMTIEQTRAAQETSEAAANFPTPRSISPPENP